MIYKSLFLTYRTDDVCFVGEAESPTDNTAVCFEQK